MNKCARGGWSVAGLNTFGCGLRGFDLRLVSEIAADNFAERRGELALAFHTSKIYGGPSGESGDPNGKKHNCEADHKLLP